MGSVLSGAVTGGSDIDIHLFADSAEEVEEFLRERRFPFEAETVFIRRGGEFLEYPHIYMEEDGVEIECTVYPPKISTEFPKAASRGGPWSGPIHFILPF